MLRVWAWTLVGCAGSAGVGDSDPTETDVDTDADMVDFPEGSYSVGPYLRWNISPEESEDSNVMVLSMSLEVEADGSVSGVFTNRWTFDEVTTQATCTHALAGYLEEGGGQVEFSLVITDFGDAVCDTTPATQSAWTDAMRTNFLWFGWIPLSEIGADWDQQGQSIEQMVNAQIGLGMELTHVAIVTSGDYYAIDPDIQPYAFFGSVERLPVAQD